MIQPADNLFIFLGLLVMIVLLLWSTGPRPPSPKWG